jgi:hypothetical protein
MTRCSPRDGQFELFAALASADKRLIARPGPHAENHPDDEASWQEFLKDRYTPKPCQRRASFRGKSPRVAGTGVDMMSACRSRISNESTPAGRT